MITERRQREFEKKPEWQAPVFACKSHFLKNYHTFHIKKRRNGGNYHERMGNTGRD